MRCDVILSQQENQYLARVKEWPQIMAYNTKRDEAIRQVQTQLVDWLTRQKVEVVQIEVPLPTETNNPWLDKFGWFKEDPTFEDLQSEIAAYRREIDKEMGIG